MKLQSYEKKIIAVYGVVILALLLSAILLRIFFTMYEVLDWSKLLSINSYVVLGVIVFIISYFLVKKIVGSLGENKKNVFALLLVIALFINAMLLGSAVMHTAKWYNAYCGTQLTIKVEGEITASYTRNKIKKRNKKRNRITVYDNVQQRNIKLETKEKYIVNTQFNDSLTKGSLGLLYKRD
jgi:hypothetical protein